MSTPLNFENLMKDIISFESRAERQPRKMDT